MRPAQGRPWLTDANASVAGAYGIDGSRSLSAWLDAPGLRRDWRFLALVRSERLLRTPYFGPHDEDRRTDSLAKQYGDIYYRYALLRSTLFATLQHRVTGPIWLHFAAQARHYRTSALRQTTLYGSDITAGRIADTLRHNGVELRLGALLDTRDDWIQPSHGLYLEAIGAQGWLLHDPGGKTQYQRWLVSGREYIQLPSGTTIIALRQRVAMAWDTLPFSLAWEQLTSWLPEDGVVGTRFIRLHRAGTRLASNEAIGSVDVRHQLLVVGDDPRPIRLWGLLFADAGLLWEPSTHPWSQKALWTIGAGFRLQPNRITLAGLDIGITDIGFNLSAVSYFAF
ncbi:MAG TPA: hypothetical protein VGI92_12280 [Gemmatimonadales bacterium]|jgi:hypothetical protein